MMRFGLFVWGASLALAQTYTVTPLPSPAGFANIFMNTINDFGQVAVTGYLANGNTQAFIGSPSGNVPIPFPPGNWTSSSAYAVNASGQVAGTINAGSSTQAAFISRLPGISVISTPVGWNGGLDFVAISDSGFAAGTATSNIPTAQAVIATTSGSLPIPLPAGTTATIGQAVNNMGQVAGPAIPFSGNSTAFIGTTWGSTLIPLPTGWSHSTVVAMNDSGQVVGTGNYGVPGPAFIGTVAGSTTIPLPTGATNANMNFGSINNNGLVVGQSDAGGWIWNASNGTISLSTVVPAGWLITNAISISNNGLILAQASFNDGPSQYVELTPTGAPSTPILSYPLNGLTGVSLTPTLSWSDSTGATSFDVYFGTSPSPSFVANTTATSFNPGPLASNTTYYWAVIARNSSGSTNSSVFSFTTYNSSCSFAPISPNILIGYQGGPAVLNVTAGSGCAWLATSSAPWLTFASGSSGIGNGTIQLSIGANAGAAQLAYVSFANQKVGVLQGGSPTAPIFNDVTSTDPYFDYVSLMSIDGITAGCASGPPALYCPSTPVTRAQMAVFIVAALDRALGTSFTTTPTPYFQDVPSTSIYFPFVQRIKELGITAGCSTTPALFCPDDSITQGQMAVFMIVGWMLANNQTSFTYTTTPYFTDVPSSDPFFKFVQKMRDLNIWTGCSAGVYCETSAVTRDQMAPMIMRSLLGTP